MMSSAALRRALCCAVVLALGVGRLAFADQLTADGDILTPDPQAQVHDCTVEHVFDGALKIAYQGNTHFDAGTTVTISVSDDSTDITATGPVSATIPSDWDGNGDEVTIPGFVTTVPAGTPGGTYAVTYTATGAGTGKSAVDGQYTTSDFFNVPVGCGTTTSNSAPTVGSISGTSSAPEGSSQSYSVSASDVDNDTLSYAWSVTGGNASIGGVSNASSVAIDFTDGPSTVDLQVVVGDGHAGHDVTRSISINETNVTPTVAAPSYSATTIDCRTSVNLTGLSFSDPGLVDNPWNVNVDWGDGSTDTNYDAATQGTQNNQAHTYNTPGNYAAGVDVTDKDGDTGSNTASNSVTVKQVYRVDFLPPFDDSSPSGLIVNTMKSGRTVPVKATIFDVCADAYVTSPAAVTIAVSKASGTTGASADAVETYADAGASSANTNAFRWTTDATAPAGGFWIYNLDSRNAINGSAMVVNQLYRVNIYTGANLVTVTDWALLKAVK